MSRRILFKLSGSIACFKACSVISQLVQRGYEVRTAASSDALRFVGEPTLEGLTRYPVFKRVDEPARMMDHLDLPKWADLTILCPATAGSINALASGASGVSGATGSPLGTLFLAHDFSKPYLIAPAMNPAMLKHPATQASLRRLQDWGVVILDTGEGNLACGDYGMGRLAEPEVVVSEVIERCPRQ